MTDIFAGLICRPPRKSYAEEDLGPPRYLLQDQMCIRRDMELRTRSRMRIKASHYLPVNSDTLEVEHPVPCVVYLHGNSGSRMDADDIVDPFLVEKISVFSIDFSGCGLSDGEYVTLGWRERGDLEAALDYLATVPELVSHVALYGRSMGAATAMLVASDERFYHRVCGLVLDSCYTSVRQMLLELAHKYVGKVPLVPVSGMIDPAVDMLRQAVKQRAGFDINKINVLDAARHCNTPVLFGHAIDDQLVLASHTRTLHKEYTGPKEVNIFEGDHNSIRPQEFRDQALLFLKKCFQDAAENDFKSLTPNDAVAERTSDAGSSSGTSSTRHKNDGGLWANLFGGPKVKSDKKKSREKSVPQQRTPSPVKRDSAIDERTSSSASSFTHSSVTDTGAAVEGLGSLAVPPNKEAWHEEIRTDDFVSAPQKTPDTQRGPNISRNFTLGSWNLLEGWGVGGAKDVAEEGAQRAQQAAAKGGLGLLLTSANGQVKVTNVAADGTAARTVQVGDLVVSVDGVSVAGMSVVEVTTLIRGAGVMKQLPVQLEFLRIESSAPEGRTVRVELPRPGSQAGGGTSRVAGASGQQPGEQAGAASATSHAHGPYANESGRPSDATLPSVPEAVSPPLGRATETAAAAAAVVLDATVNRSLAETSDAAVPGDRSAQGLKQVEPGEGALEGELDASGGEEEGGDGKDAMRVQRREEKQAKARAKRLTKLRAEGVLFDRSCLKDATLVSTLVPFHGKAAQHQKREEPISSSVTEAAAGEWVVETVVKHTLDDHLDWFWHRPQLVAMGRDMFPNVKEITESVSAFRAAVRYVEEHMGGEAAPCYTPGAMEVVCVADGGSPRTASLFATYLPQQVHSVDPAMHARYIAAGGVPAELLSQYKKGGVTAYACTIEEWVRRLPPPAAAVQCVLVVAVHSHALLEDYIPQVRMHFRDCRVLLLATPCCVEQRLCPPPGSPTSKGLDLSLQPAREFSDMGIHSHDRTVRIWDLPAVATLGMDLGPTRLCVSMRTHTDKSKKGNYDTEGGGGRHRLISDMYGQHH